MCHDYPILLVFLIDGKEGEIYTSVPAAAGPAGVQQGQAANDAELHTKEQ